MKKIEQFKCDFCDKVFSSKQGKDKHTKEYCTSNPHSTRSIINKENKDVMQKAIENIADENDNSLLDKEVIANDKEAEVVEEKSKCTETEEVIANDKEAEVVEEKSKYTETEKYLINFFRDKKLDDIYIPASQKAKISDIFTSTFNKSLNFDCPYQSVHGITSLYFWLQNSIKNK